MLFSSDITLWPFFSFAFFCLFIWINFVLDKFPLFFWSWEILEKLFYIIFRCLTQFSINIVSKYFVTVKELLIRIFYPFIEYTMLFINETSRFFW